MPWSETSKRTVWLFERSKRPEKNLERFCEGELDGPESLIEALPEAIKG
jgi:hypothetical protein